MVKEKVLVAMSGGLDSSVAAYLLIQQGYDVVGITIKTWDYEMYGGENIPETSCCSLESVNDARNLAVSLGFPHYILDMKDEFEHIVVQNFVDEYLQGRTPNPCVICNKYFKWDALLKKATQLGCKYIATGHYAKIFFENDRYFIRKAADDKKEQSYVLWRLTQEHLSRTLFPLGGLNKTKVREIAAGNNFKNLVSKRESYDICFIPDNDYRSFLKRRQPDLEDRLKGGDFIDKNNKLLGKHEGYPFYTIGQRKGLKVAVGEPLYVNHIDPATNTIRLGFKDELITNDMDVQDFNLMKYTSLHEPLKVLTKVRYHDNGTESFIVEKDGKIHVSFPGGVSSVTPGQSAVFYEGGDLVGGGLIQ